MTTSTSLATRSTITIAAGFLGAFIVGSLAVQLWSSQTRYQQSPATGVEPIVAGPSAIWSDLAAPDLASTISQSAVVTPAADVEFVVGSEATLWSTLGER